MQTPDMLPVTVGSEKVSGLFHISEVVELIALTLWVPP